MYTKPSFLIAAGVSALLCATSAGAATLRVDSLTSSFHSNVGGTIIYNETNADGDSRVGWGEQTNWNGSEWVNSPIAAEDASGYDLDLLTPVDPVMENTQFELARFTHNNHVIYGGSIDAISFDLDAELSIDFDDGNGYQSIGPRTFSFDVDHNETPNNPDSGICEPNDAPLTDAVNANGCADVVDISTALGSDSFIINGIEFTLTIIGFLNEATNELSSSFYSMEDASNERILIAEFSATRVSEVPLPASVLLLLGGVAGLGALRRRRRAA